MSTRHFDPFWHKVLPKVIIHCFLKALIYFEHLKLCNTFWKKTINIWLVQQIKYNKGKRATRVFQEEKNSREAHCTLKLEIFKSWFLIVYNSLIASWHRVSNYQSLEKIIMKRFCYYKQISQLCYSSFLCFILVMFPIHIRSYFLLKVKSMFW